MLVLVEQLPPESALNTAIRNATPQEDMPEGDSDKAGWSTTDLLLATLIDEIRAYRADFAQSHSKSKVTRPAPIRRPGVGRLPLKRIDVAKLKELDPRLRGLSDDEAINRFREMTGRA